MSGANAISGICHAGVGTVETLVTAGKPVLALPQHLEQMMTAKRLAALGAGLVVDPNESPATMAASCVVSWTSHRSRRPRRRWRPGMPATTPARIAHRGAVRRVDPPCQSPVGQLFPIMLAYQRDSPL